MLKGSVFIDDAYDHAVYLVLLLALDFHFGRKAFQQKTYEPVFPWKWRAGNNSPK
ncbi:hypothetical protein VSK92_20155 [Bacillus swezeyi]|uniref:hypothetical protein n=1 Tax=Bacillus swezeyi TaxID=1925020 RepID=UPI001CC2275C|nr:hypothetical protein [Bacillus swezeyi]